MALTRTALLVSTTIAAACLASAPASAQTTTRAQVDPTVDPTTASATPSGQDTANAQGGNESGIPQDVVVTAQKREQRLIDVPQSVSVVSGATLENQQASTFQDYLKLVPGLQLNQSQPGTGRLILRGINTGGVASTVAVYVDDTPFGSSSGLANGAVLAGDFDTFDIARIEVLRGPQGTLYGANSLGGLLKFVTNAPDTTKLEARVRGSVEDVRGGEVGYSGNALINVPLGDTLAVRASGYYRKYGGFIDSIGTPVTIPTGPADNPGPDVLRASDVQRNINSAISYGGRASLLFRPVETFSIRLSALLQNIDAKAPDVVESDPFTLRELYGRPTQSQFVPQFRNTAYRLYDGVVNFNFGPATLTSITSYATLDQVFRLDETVYLNRALRGALGTPDFALPQQTRQRKFTEEVRLASAKSDRFDWLVGGYYTHETGRIHQSFVAFNPGTLTPATGLPVLADVVLPSRYTEYAGFANGTIYFGKVFDLTLGGRYSHNDQSANQTSSGPLSGGGGIFPTSRSSDNVFTYSVAPKINFSRNASLYGRVAKGYRPGGPNVLPPSTGLGVTAPVSTPRRYGADTVTSYEIGFKGETDDRKFSIDLAAFHIDWNRIQLLTIVNGFGVNDNGGRARSDGVEFTATARPIAGFSVSANGAFTRARLRDATSLLVGGFAGDRLPYVPTVSIGLDGNYERTLAGETKAFVGASLRSLSKQNGDFDYIFRTTYGRQRQIPAYEVVDLRAGVDFARFQLEVYAKNLTDALGRTSAGATFPTPSNFPDGAVGTGVIRPRTVGVSLSAGF